MALNTRQQGRRLPPEIFDLPVEKMREGYYTDAYFNHTRSALLADERHPRVVMQVFQRKHAMLGGLDEALAILELCSDDWAGLTVHALRDGDQVDPWETVMTIEGDYTAFAHLETVYLGTLARRTLITTNVVRVLEAANGKPIIFMPARHDHHRVQTGDGYAAYTAGLITGAEIGVTTDEQASWWGGRGVGTVPHGLIAAYGGDSALAARKFADRYARHMNVTVLVDFVNDSVRTALEVVTDVGAMFSSAQTGPLRARGAVTTGEAAEVCRVSQQTIIRCFDAGRLKGFRVPGSRFRRGSQRTRRLRWPPRRASRPRSAPGRRGPRGRCPPARTR